MATESLFQDYIREDFPKFVAAIVEKLNGKIQSELPYLYRGMLRKEYSVSGIWESLSVFNNRVVADYVALDSDLPLKKRDSLRKAVGEIAKQGIMYQLNERQLRNLQLLRKTGAQESEILQRLFEDVSKCITGIYENIERTFLEGFSSGVAEIDDSENVGIGARLNYNYLDENKFTPVINWSDRTNAKPLSDIARIKKAAKAKGVILRYIYMNEATFEDFIANAEVKDFYAWRIGFTGNTSLIQQPTLEQINQVLRSDTRYGVEIEIVDRQFIREKDGVQTTFDAWAANSVILTTEKEVGILFWTDLAEMDNHIAGVNYSKVDEFILVSKFGENRPALSEFTAAQACVVPVICNVEQIYQLDAAGASSDSTASDSNVTLWGTEYTKASVLAGLTTIGAPAPDGATEAQIAQHVNKLSKAKQNQLKPLLTEYTAPAQNGEG